MLGFLATALQGLGELRSMGDKMRASHSVRQSLGERAARGEKKGAIARGETAALQPKPFWRRSNKGATLTGQTQRIHAAQTAPESGASREVPG